MADPKPVKFDPSVVDPTRREVEEEDLKRSYWPGGTAWGTSWLPDLSSGANWKQAALGPIASVGAGLENMVTKRQEQLAGIGSFTPDPQAGVPERITPALPPAQEPAPPGKTFLAIPTESSSSTWHTQLGRAQDEEYLKEQVRLGTGAIGLQKQRAEAERKAIEVQKAGLGVMETELFGKPVIGPEGKPTGERTGGTFAASKAVLKEWQDQNKTLLDRFSKPIQPKASEAMEPGMEPKAVLDRALKAGGIDEPGVMKGQKLSTPPKQEGKVARPQIDVEGIQTKYEAANAALEDSVQKLKEAKIDPLRRFSTPGGLLANFVGVIGAGLAAIGQGLTGQPFATNVLNMLNAAADRDIEAQRLEMNKLLQVANLTEKQRDSLYRQWNDMEKMRKDALMRAGQLKIAEISTDVQKATAMSQLATNRALLDIKLADTQTKAADAILAIQGQLSGEKHKEFIAAQPTKSSGGSIHRGTHFMTLPGTGAQKPVSPSLQKEQLADLEMIKSINKLAIEYGATDPSRFQTIRRLSAAQDSFDRRMTDIVNKHRVLVTGISAPESELKRIIKETNPGVVSGWEPWRTRMDIMRESAYDRVVARTMQNPALGVMARAPAYYEALSINPMGALKGRVR
jgi:hypothetical protein